MKVLLLLLLAVSGCEFTIRFHMPEPERKKPDTAVVKPSQGYWERVRPPVQLGGGIDDGYEWVEETPKRPSKHDPRRNFRANEVDWLGEMDK